MDRRHGRAVDAVVDALDIETYLLCRDAREGHDLALELARELGFADADVMFEAFDGLGVRVRLRCTVHRPAGRYAWLEEGGS